MARPRSTLDPARVAFAADFLARLERLVAEVSAARGREDAASRARSGGGGDEFAGHRPYQPGEDLRDLDWELYARLERPFVRLRQREAGERWTVACDTSASMGLGEPGKLQLAAEVATAIASCGLAAGATTELVAFSPAGAIESIRLRKREDLGAWLAFLEARRAVGARSTRELVADPRSGRCTRLFAVGDLFDLEPGDLLVRAARGRSVSAVRVLARHELAPRQSEGTRWSDPETGDELDLRVGGAALEAYSRALERRLEAWRASLARHGQRGWVWTSDAAFEDVARAVLR
jgi:uncharacterized protein (DUF58 family)